MKFLEEQINKIGKLFRKGKPLERLYPLFEATDTFLLTPGKTTTKAPFVRDAIDIKRVMIFVVIALIPCVFMGIYNTGYQIQIAKGLTPVFGESLWVGLLKVLPRSEEHTSELQSHSFISYAVFCLKKKKKS